MAFMPGTAPLTKSSAVPSRRKNITFFCPSTVGATVCLLPSVTTRSNVPNAPQLCFFWNFTLSTTGFLWMNYMKGQCPNTVAVVLHRHPAQSPTVQFPPAVVNYL